MNMSFSMHSGDWLKRQNLRPDWFVLRENSSEVDVKRGKNKATAVKRGGKKGDGCQAQEK